jgi:hypothetical protein
MVAKKTYAQLVVYLTAPYSISISGYGELLMTEYYRDALELDGLRFTAIVYLAGEHLPNNRRVRIEQFVEPIASNDPRQHEATGDIGGAIMHSGKYHVNVHNPISRHVYRVPLNILCSQYVKLCHWLDESGDVFDYLYDEIAEVNRQFNVTRTCRTEHVRNIKIEQMTLQNITKPDTYTPPK